MTKVKPALTKRRLGLRMKSQEKPNGTSQYEKLALMKVEAKELEAKIKALQMTIIEKGGKEKVETSVGTLTFYHIDKWETVDKEAVLDIMGSDSFIEHCSISKTGIIKGVGDRGFNELAKIKAVQIKYSYDYYKLKTKKK